MMMTLEELRNRLSGRLHAADISELCRMAQDEAGDEMKAGLLGFAGDEDRRLASNALWTFSYFDAPARRWLQTRQAELIDMAMTAPDATSRRLLLTLLEHQTFEAESLRTDFLDACLSRLVSDTEPVAIRSLSMKIAYKMCRHYPELLEELRMAIDMTAFSPTDSAGLRSCRRKILRLIGRQGKSPGPHPGPPQGEGAYEMKGKDITSDI